jgi:hypothetical protein
MPFYAAKPDEGSSGPSIGGPVTMRVEPDKVLDLKARLEAVHDNVDTFFRQQGDNLRARPLAQDDVSVDAANIFAKNADTAIEVGRQFVLELEKTVEQLGEIARTYSLVEDVNRTAMQQENGGV